MKKEKLVLITGGGSGLGLELVKYYLKENYNVASISRNRNQTIDFLLENTKNLKWCFADINDQKSVNEFIQSVTRDYGAIDLFINNIGYLYEGIISFTPITEIERTVYTNVITPIILTREILKYMIPEKNGVIINVSSINSIKGHKGVSVYGASKAAIDSLTRSLAKELGPLNIRVNSVVPGFFNSGLVNYLTEERRKQILKRTPLGRLGDAKDMLNAIVFLASDNASFITGQHIVIDGGMTC